jgi:AraC family transcriptional regulator
MKTTTLDRFHARLQRVADHLAGHLDEPLSIDRLAGIAAMSPFHFHRLWTATLGETVASSVRRLRLERAARQLRESAEPVTSIALAAGFASAQAFARAFRAAAGVSPSEYREAPETWPAWRLPTGTTREAGRLEVRLVRTEPLTIVAMRRTGAYTDSDLAEDFQVPWQWAQDTGRLEGLRGIYGVPWNEPEVAEVPLFFAGLDLGPCPRPPSPLECLTLPGGDHAVARLVGPFDGIDAVVNELYRAWLPSSGREPADTPLFHHYLDDPETTPEHALRTDIYLPLRERRA